MNCPLLNLLLHRTAANCALLICLAKVFWQPRNAFYSMTHLYATNVVFFVFLKSSIIFVDQISHLHIYDDIIFCNLFQAVRFRFSLVCCCFEWNHVRAIELGVWIYPQFAVAVLFDKILCFVCLRIASNRRGRRQV
jgi:hypothetical protein